MAFDIANEFFLDFIKALNRASVSYMLIGGYAVNYYGYNRTTADMDIWLKPDNENRMRFINALLYLGFEQAEVEDIAADDFTSHLCYTFGSMPNHIDVLTFIHKDVQFDSVEKNVVRHQLDNNEEIKIIPHDVLVDVKLRTGRLKDMQDASQLLEIKRIKNDGK